MKKSLTLLFIILILFSVGDVVSSDLSEGKIIINISLLFGLLFIWLCSDLFKVSSLVQLILEILVIALGWYLGFRGFEFVIPVIIFKVTNKWISLNIFILIVIPIALLIAREEYLYVALYNVLIALYMYKVKETVVVTASLKELYKGERDEKHNVDKKMDNLQRYLDQNSLLVTLKERNFMAQKLHDHLGHRITSAVMQLEVTKETLGNDNNLSIKYLESAMGNLREGMDEIRTLLRKVKPKETMVGIEEIKERILKFQYDSNININLKIEGDFSKVPQRYWNIILQNITEALTNAGKYSKGTEIVVSIHVYNKFMRVEIHDNGQGCGVIKKGLGLKGIEERIEAIGGRVEFFVDNGFVINMIINLEGRN